MFMVVLLFKIPDIETHRLSWYLVEVLDITQGTLITNLYSIARDREQGLYDVRVEKQIE